MPVLVNKKVSNENGKHTKLTHTRSSSLDALKLIKQLSGNGNAKITNNQNNNEEEETSAQSKRASTLSENDRQKQMIKRVNSNPIEIPSIVVTELPSATFTNLNELGETTNEESFHSGFDHFSIVLHGLLLLI